MPVWRCPHCSTPQAEAARCWVCHRSTTSCGTCRHFRSGIASGLGLCGLDPRRAALTGREMRACWAAPDPADATSATTPGDAAISTVMGDYAPRRERTFVPVDDLGAVPSAPSVMSAPPAPRRTHDPWSLWGDTEA